ncbi:hypothetical protein psyc5s11_26980 [Clostridium gelidum]|uniref:DUF434 domain-containing protein n=1 Tax=Clostridium gelidum TaxID=704125 RepID=A0ABN6IY98_9CLOT|nr:DUF434 domain-containing protein [Clostridium gelidum]BCZ46631.1 hypothetical protein psyc5s11_26980 [Clostridium gelidum]
MSKEVRRGYVPTDAKEFSDKNLELIKRAQSDVFMLLERGYPIKSASTFVGNHYLLSERQRLAIVRSTSQSENIIKRNNKLLKSDFEGKIVYIDGLNLIITLEVALSESTVLKCMDGTIRDLAGLRGTYKLIDKTDIAIEFIGEKLAEMEISEVNFYLDSPVSNTGKLKQRILELLAKYSYEVKVELVNNADVILETKSCVITSDAIILNKCKSWINFAYDVVLEKLPNFKYIDLKMNKAHENK